MVALENQGAAMALLRVTKALLWVKLVAWVFLSNIICLLVVVLANQGVAMALLLRC